MEIPSLHKRVPTCFYNTIYTWSRNFWQTESLCFSAPNCKMGKTRTHTYPSWIGSNESNFETHLGASLKWKPRSQSLLELNCHPKTVGHLPVILSNGQIRKHLNNFDNFDIPNGESMNRLLEDHQAEIHPPKCNVDILDNMDTKILPGAGLCRVPWGNRVEIWSSPIKQRVN